MYVRDSCYGLFVDIEENLYCCLENTHQVIIRSFNDSINSTLIIGGNGTAGSRSDKLNQPRGIFVDSNLTLYVADCGNDRIQRFPSGQTNGLTVAITGSITLNCPSGVVLDADGYLFIADSGNSQIIGSGPDGFRCLIGCGTLAGPALNQIDQPAALSFDNYGNLFVADTYNNRILKFLLATNSSGK
jgi:DNA-binding beta-propeller fold protein YncE